MTLRVTGLDDVKRMLEGVRERTAQPRPALEAWAESVGELVAASASAARTPEGDRWAPRKQVARSRGKTYPRRVSAQRGRVGVITGAMIASIRAGVSGRSVSLSVLAPYAAYFASGSRRRGIPSRSILPSRNRGAYGQAFQAFIASLASYAVSGRVR